MPPGTCRIWAGWTPSCALAGIDGTDLVQDHRCASCHGAENMGGRQMLPLPHLRERYLAKALTDYGAECRIGDRAAIVKIDPLAN